jgi:signal transduction histidine kinase
MGLFFQQVFKLLTTQPGSLAYHLVLAFSVVGALQSSFNHWRSNDFPQGRRMVVGLALLLLVQLVLFSMAGLTWQGVIDAGRQLPFIDRAAALLSLILIIWLWGFPETARLADVATALLEVLTIILTVIGGIWWAGQNSNLDFNSTWPDLIWVVTGLILSILGLMLLIIRRPNGWGYGLSMMTLIGLGFLTHLLYPLQGSDYPGAVRLALMAAYPLLLLLPQRFPITLTRSWAPGSVEGLNVEEANATTWLSLLQLTGQPTLDDLLRAIPGAIANLLQVEVCLLVTPPYNEGHLKIASGYDRLQGTELAALAVNTRNVPVITSSLGRNKPVTLPASSTSPDLIGLSQALGVKRSGPLVAQPFFKDKRPVFSLILLSSNASHQWSMEDEEKLVLAGTSLAHLVQLRQELESTQGDLNKVEQNWQSTQASVEQAHTEKQTLNEELARLRESAAEDRAQLQSLAAMVANQLEAQSTLPHSSAGKILRDTSYLASELQQEEQVGGELRMALEEMALLRESLNEANQKITDLEKGEERAAPPIPVNLLEQFHSPLSNIQRGLDYLLDESVDMLSVTQKENLDQVRVSAERLSWLVEDMLHTAPKEKINLPLSSQPVNLAVVLAEACNATDLHRTDKGLALSTQVDIDLPLVYADRQVLLDIFNSLLENAIQVTPAGGEISLKAVPQPGNNLTGFVSIRIRDGGPGISIDDLPKFFSDPQYSDLPGGLPAVKAKVEELGGHIWVDSEPDQGAVITLLLPTQPPLQDFESPNLDENQPDEWISEDFNIDDGETVT